MPGLCPALAPCYTSSSFFSLLCHRLPSTSASFHSTGTPLSPVFPYFTALSFSSPRLVTFVRALTLPIQLPHGACNANEPRRNLVSYVQAQVTYAQLSQQDFRREFARVFFFGKSQNSFFLHLFRLQNHNLWNWGTIFTYTPTVIAAILRSCSE